MTRMTTGTAVVETLLQHGVDTVFGLPGVQIYEYFDALQRAGDRVSVYTTRHEQAAAYMAFGYAQSTGRVGTYMVVPGPGVLNTTAALCTAYGTNTPVFCVTGQVPAAFIGSGRGELHELPDQLGVLRSLTKWAERIDHPAQAPSLVAEGFRQLRSGRVRPVAVETPWDVCGMEGEVTLVEPLEPYPAIEPDPDAVARAAQLLADAKNPMIMLGGGAINAGAEVEALAAILQAPVTSSRSGRGIVSVAHELGMLFPAARKFWKETDLLLGIGSRLELHTMRWPDMPADLPMVRIDIDPVEMTRLKPTVGIVGDAKTVMADLVQAVSARAPTRTSRREEFAAAKSAAAEEVQKMQPQMGYLNAIRDVLPRDGIYVEEITQVGFAAWSSLPTYAPRTYITAGYQGTLGFGYPTALGVKVGNPDREVVSIAGDGGFMFGVQELATSAQYGINLVTVIFNNSSYGNVLRDQQQRYSGREIGSRLRNPDFVAMAESFGVIGRRAANPEELRAELEAGFSADEPTIIEVPIESGSEASPWEFIIPNRER